MLADNLHSLTVHEAEAFGTIKDGYKINRTYAFSHLKRCLLILMPTAEQFVATFKKIAKNLIGVVPDVSKPRPNHPKPQRKHDYKSTC
ncbi:MAG: hypothetical protein PHR16_00985 [Methylovulum sp.]|nr:hypothetical protein [Methylovulum sp.]